MKSTRWIRILFGAGALYDGLLGAGHARQLGVQAEIVLEGDGGQRLVFALDLNMFLGFKGLVQTVGITAAIHHAARELVDDDDFALFDDVINIAGEHLVRAKGLVDVVHDHDVLRIVETAARRQQACFAQQNFDMNVAGFGQRNRLGLFVALVIFGDEVGDQRVDFDIKLGTVFGGA